MSAMRVVAVAAAVVVLVAGCSKEQSGPDEDELGALDQLFQEIYGDFDEDYYNAQQLEMEELIAECMVEQGFQYTPVDWSQGGGGVIIDDMPDLEWGTREFAEKYGYGATTNPWGDQVEPLPMPVDEWVDPNMEYVNAMSPAEQEAYYAALYGTPVYTDDPEAEYEYRWEDAGCQGYAQHEVYGDGPVSNDDFAALEEEMQRMWEGIMNDPRITELNRDWSDCMAEAGYPGFATVDDAANSIFDKVNAIYEDAYVDMPPDADEEYWREIEERNQELIAEITPLEIATATADFECRDEVRYDDIQQEINFDHQQDFYDAHRAELEAWRDAAIAARG